MASERVSTCVVEPQDSLNPMEKFRSLPSMRLSTEDSDS